jgi:SOS-response transcriptional repressor LexA
VNYVNTYCVKKLKFMKNSDRLKIIRETIGVSQTEFARVLDVAPSFISGIERDKKDVSRELLQKLLEKYQININWLLSGSGMMFLNENNRESENPPQIPRLGAMMDERLETIESRMAEIENRIREINKDAPDSGMFVSDPEPEYDEILDDASFVEDIAAGRPIYASQNRSTISIPRRYFKTKPEDYYAGRIKGTSMIAAGIPDGVIVLIRISDVPRDGAIQVVEHQGEVTIKRIREIPGGGWKICFDDYSGRYIEVEPGDEFHIQGDFVAVLPEEEVKIHL